MDVYGEFLKFKQALIKYRYVCIEEWAEDFKDYEFEYGEFLKLIYQPYDNRFTDIRECLEFMGVSYIQECLKKTLQNNLDDLCHETLVSISTYGEITSYQKRVLQRYQNIIDELNLPWKIDEETYTILTEPETLIDEYFHSQVAKLETNSIENELSLALDSLKQGNATACFTHTRKFTEALKKQLIKTKTVDDFKVPFANSQFYTLNQKMYQLLSDAVHHNQRTWTIDEAKFLLRMAITLNAYYEKIDSKIATQQEHFEEVPF
ncbi:MAG: hypothetical protein HEQ32_09160 [Vampirovibrio sp.]